jgi:hypothetical protein
MIFTCPVYPGACLVLGLSQNFCSSVPALGPARNAPRPRPDRTPTAPRRQIEKAVESREGALAQARTSDKAELAKALYLALESLRQARPPPICAPPHRGLAATASSSLDLPGQAKVDKEQELLMATKQARRRAAVPAPAGCPPLGWG